MKKTIVILFFLLPHLLKSQEWQIAVINDPDGFTFIRSGAGKDFTVVDTIRDNQFFYCTGDTSGQWLPVQNSANGKNGFMHHSRIIFFCNLDSLRQHELITSAFSEIIKFEKTYWNRVKNCPQEKLHLLYDEETKIYEGKYVPAYEAMEKIFCAKPDSILLVAFFKTLPYMTGSADEGKDWTCARCWITHPQFVDRIVCQWKNESERQIIISSVKTGIAMSDVGKDYSPAQLKKMYAALEKKCN